MSDQKELKKRLKVLMNRPENQVCADCPERQPRWASLIVPPPGAPQGSLPIGAFMCLECSGAHRRLGVHISFVRSINLDSWKEREVCSMENGGNAKVNALFEARLNVQKPSNHADGPTRERFIRDKYERRKFYDPAAFLSMAQHQQQQMQQQPAQGPPRPPPQRAHSQDDITWSGSGSTSVGPPSDAARQRVEERNRQQRTLRKSSSISSDDSSGGGGGGGRRAGGSGGARRPTRPGGTRSGQRPKVAQAPVSAPPPQMDLLDFSSSSPPPEEQQQPPSSPRKGNRPKSRGKEGSNGASGGGGGDSGGDSGGAGADLFADFLAARNESWAPTTPGTTDATATPGALGQRPTVASSAAIKNSASVSQDILSLYGSPSPQVNGHNNMGGAGMMMMNNNNNNNNNSNSMAGMTNMMQQMNMNQQHNPQMQPNTMTPAQMQMMMQMQQQQQQQQQMMMMNNMHASMPNLNYGGSAGAGMNNFAAFAPQQHTAVPNNFATTFSNGFGPDGFGHSNGGGPPMTASTFGKGFGGSGVGRSGGSGGRSVGGSNSGAASNRRLASNLQHQSSAPPTMVNDNDPFASLGNTRSHR